MRFPTPLTRHIVLLSARELALWMTLQREFYRRNLLPQEALARFEAVQVSRRVHLKSCFRKKTPGAAQIE